MQSLNLNKFYEFETLGVQAKDCSCPNVAISLQDKKATELMENSCKLEDGCYTVGLPWKKDKSLLPNDYPLAERRLFSLERNLLKDEKKARRHNKVITKYERNGWASALTEEAVADPGGGSRGVRSPPIRPDPYIDRIVYHFLTG